MRDIMHGKKIVFFNAEQGDHFVVLKGKTYTDLLTDAHATPKVILRCAESIVSEQNISNFRADSAQIGVRQPEELIFTTVLQTYNKISINSLRIEVQLEGHTIYETSLTELEITKFKPVGEIEFSFSKGISGWLLAPTRRGHQKDVSLYIDEDTKTSINLDIERPDLAINHFADKKNFGFELSIERLTAKLRGSNTAFRFKSGQRYHIVMRVGGDIAAEKTINFLSEIEGRVERLTKAELAGWAIQRPQYAMPPIVELYIDKVRYLSTRAGIDRSDLRAKGIANKWGGYKFHRPLELPSYDSFAEVEITAQHAATNFYGKNIPTIPRDFPNSRIGTLPASLCSEISADIAIVIAAFNAPDELDLCLSSLIDNTTAPVRLIVIDDASTDLRVGEVLDKWRSLANVEIHVNDVNLGYTKTINIGITLAASCDVILLNSDTIVTPRWLEKLSRAAYSAPKIATVTAVANNAGAFSVPETGVSNIFPRNMNAATVSRVFARKGGTIFITAPTGNGFCMYIRREAIDRIGHFDQVSFPRGYGEENDFCMRAAYVGMLNVIDNATYIYHKRSSSFGSEKADLYAAGRKIIDERYPEYSLLVRDFLHSRKMDDMRWLCRSAISNPRLIRLANKVRCLYVISTQTGGTPQTNADLMVALSARIDPWILRCDARTIELYQFEAPTAVLKHKITLADPVRVADHKSPEYDLYISFLLELYSFELVHVRHFAWHSLGLFDACNRLEIPVILSFHDFYTVCPTVKLLDESLSYCGGRCTSGDGPCRAELWPSSDVPPLKHQFVLRWQAMMYEVLQKCDAFITTSESARAVLTSNYQVLSSKDFRVIPHGRSFEQMQCVAFAPQVNEPLRILVPGNISIAKGSRLISTISLLDVAGALEFHILGNPGELRAAKNIIIHGTYDREEFGARAASIRPNVGVILSIWPETYCHTLTELWACGVPVLGLDIGAIGERLKTNGGGWLLRSDADPQEIYSQLLSIKSNASDHRSKILAVLDWQLTEGTYYTTKAMAASYDRVYRDVISRRRSLAICDTWSGGAGSELLYLDHNNSEFALVEQEGWLESNSAKYICGLNAFQFIATRLDSPVVAIKVATLHSSDVADFLETVREARAVLSLDARGLAHNPMSSNDGYKIVNQIVKFDFTAVICFDLHDITQTNFQDVVITWMTSYNPNPLSHASTSQSTIATSHDNSIHQIESSHVQKRRHSDHRTISVVMFHSFDVDGLMVRVSDVIVTLPSTLDIVVLDFTGAINEVNTRLLDTIIEDSNCSLSILTCESNSEKYQLLSEALNLCRGDLVWLLGFECFTPTRLLPNAINTFPALDAAMLYWNGPALSTDREHELVHAGWAAVLEHHSLPTPNIILSKLDFLIKYPMLKASLLGEIASVFFDRGWLERAICFLEGSSYISFCMLYSDIFNYLCKERAMLAILTPGDRNATSAGN